MTLDLSALPARSQSADDFIQGSIARDLRHVLPVVARLNRSAESQFSRRHTMLAHQCAQKCRFPAAVWPDEAKDVAALNSRAEIVDESPALHRQSKFTCNSNLVATSFGQV